MKIAYFDCFAGISGDMILGALIDSGLDIELLKTGLGKLQLDGWQLTTEKISKNGIAGTKVNVVSEEQKAHRHLRHILEIIDSSGCDDVVKSNSKKIFRRLAEVEAKIHDTTPEKIHFHEVGALDAIIDIVGGVIGLHLLGIEKIYASTIHLGSGFVDCAHGRIPLPSPATVALLHDIPTYSTGIQNELTTPTGAAVISTLAESFGPMPLMTIKSTGYGAGRRDLEIPNLLRLIIGETSDNFDHDTVSIIETNIDDMNPEFYNHIITKLIGSGAIDAFINPVVMKKNRQGALLTVLSAPDKVDGLVQLIFSETTSFGVRLRLSERRKLKREIRMVKTKYGEVAVKIGFSNGEIISVMPEYEDCRTIAEKSNIPLRVVYDTAKAAFTHLTK